MASEISDLSDMMTTDQISQLSSVYSDVEDIDLYIGGLMERPVPGGRLGPTFSCIIADQVKLKFRVDKLTIQSIPDEEIKERRQIFLFS